MSGSVEAKLTHSSRHLCIDKDRGGCKPAAEGAACAENDDFVCIHVGGGRYIRGVSATAIPCLFNISDATATEPVSSEFP